ncbi:MAG: hypothetical protein WC682_03655 [Parcubacteria group bacterium]|jgi:hypothetical protein
MIKLVNTAGFIAINQENKILLVRQCKGEKEQTTKDDNLILPKKDIEEVAIEEWLIPFCAIDDDENPRDALKKEIKKCLSCDVEDCNYFNLYFYNISDSFIKKVSYFYGTISGEAKVKDSSSNIEWISLEKSEIAKLNLTPEQKEVLNDFIDFHQDKFLEKMD